MTQRQKALKALRFHDLTPYRVREVLLVSSPYDAFILEEDGQLTEKVFWEYREVSASGPPRFTQVSSVDAAFEAGVRPRCHLEDLTRADIDGFVLPFVDRLMRMSEQVPAEQSVKIRLCDTMGFGLSFPGAQLPRSIPNHRLVCM